MKEVGKRLKYLREGIGVSQGKLAQMLGTTQSSINRYENGQTVPTVATFDINLVFALHVHLLFHSPDDFDQASGPIMACANDLKTKD